MIKRRRRNNVGHIICDCKIPAARLNAKGGSIRNNWGLWFRKVLSILMIWLSLFELQTRLSLQKVHLAQTTTFFSVKPLLGVTSFEISQDKLVFLIFFSLKVFLSSFSAQVFKLLLRRNMRDFHNPGIFAFRPT